MKWCFALFVITGLLAGLTIAQEENLDLDVDDEEPIVEQIETVESISYESPYADPNKYYFAEHFDDYDQYEKKWIKSQAKKDEVTEAELAKYDGVWEVEQPQRPILRDDLGLVLKSKAKHAAISSRLNRPFVFSDKPLIVQYEITLQDGQECGGAYIKLLSSGKETTDLKTFQDKTPYTIMFGPDKCGNDVKFHFIFRHVNPINGTITEKHCKKPKDRLQEPFNDKEPHLYTLIINPDNTFVVKVDHKTVNEGSLLSDFTPAVNPLREIDDPEDTKPSDWDEREKIPDPDASKPLDWDDDAPPQIPDAGAVKPDLWFDEEEEMIPDPNAEKPADWDVEMDGEWEAPLIDNPMCEKAVGCGLWKAPLITNPQYKGKWRAPLIDNPNYQGKWSPKKILNPEFFEDLNPFKMTAIAAVGIELWSMSSEILFDNFVIVDDIALANEWAAQTYDLKRKQIDKEAETFVSRLVSFTNENPWMWAVYVVIVGLPLALIIFFMCSSKDKLDSKKTDEPTIDDDEIQPEEHKLASEQPKKSSLKTESPKGKKSALDEPSKKSSPSPVLVDDNDDEEEDVGVESSSSNEEVEAVEDVEIKTKETESNKKEEGTRKRNKPRRE